MPLADPRDVAPDGLSVLDQVAFWVFFGGSAVVLAFCAAFISSSDPPLEERRPSPRSSRVQILQALNLAPYVVEHAVFDNVWVIRVNQQMSAEIASAGCDLQREVVIGLAQAWRPGESVSVEVESYTGRTLARQGRGWLGQPEYHCE